MAIPCIPVNKIVEGSNESILANVICKVVAFQIVDKNVVFDVFDASYLSTFVKAGWDLICFCGCMGHNSFHCSSIFCFNYSIMIALNPEDKESFALDHLIVGLLILRIRFHVVDVNSEVAATDRQHKVNQICNNDDDSSCNDSQKIFIPNSSYNKTGKKYDSSSNDKRMERALLLDWIILLSKGRISNIEKHISKSISNTLVADRKDFIVRIEVDSWY